MARCCALPAGREAGEGSRSREHCATHSVLEEVVVAGEQMVRVAEVDAGEGDPLLAMDAEEGWLTGSLVLAGDGLL